MLCRWIFTVPDEMWSYVGSKANQRWLWHAIDRATGTVLAYVLGWRQDEIFLELKAFIIGALWHQPVFYR